MAIRDSFGVLLAALRSLRGKPFDILDVTVGCGSEANLRRIREDPREPAERDSRRRHHGFWGRTVPVVAYRGERVHEELVRTRLFRHVRLEIRSCNVGDQTIN